MKKSISYSAAIPLDQVKRPRSHEIARLKKYGLTPDTYNAMLAAQNNGCAICGKVPHSKSYLVVDHCHYSGIVRELLCSQCNALLGFANDNTETLAKAIDYLKKHTT